MQQTPTAIGTQGEYHEGHQAKLSCMRQCYKNNLPGSSPSNDIVTEVLTDMLLNPQDAESASDSSATGSNAESSDRTSETDGKIELNAETWDRNGSPEATSSSDDASTSSSSSSTEASRPGTLLSGLAPPHYSPNFSRVNLSLNPNDVTNQCWLGQTQPT